MTSFCSRWLIPIAALALLAGCDDEPEADGDAAADMAPDPDMGPRVDMAPDPDAGPRVDMAPEADMGPVVDMGPMVDMAPDPDMAPEADMGPDPAWTSEACAYAAYVGGFEIALRDGFTSVQGQVADGVVPLEVPVVDAEEGPCRLLRPPSLFCDPGCGVGETCGPDGCIAQPANIDLGPVTVDGLTAAVEMEARAPVFFYTFRGDLPHPGFAEGDVIRLEGDGIDGIDPFTLRGQGVALLVVDGDTLPLEEGRDAQLTWDPPAVAGPAQMHIELNIANHGGTPARIECVTEDDGDFAIPSALVDRLLALGYSGFPSVALTRRTVDHTALPQGCAELRVQSTAVLDVAIDGLISCSLDDDCPDGETCQPDLTCG